MRIKTILCFGILIISSTVALAQTVGYGYEVIKPRYKANTQPTPYESYNSTYSQLISCTEAYQLILNRGEYIGTVSPPESEWLKKVTAYKMDGELYVETIVKRDEYGIKTDAYIFCGVPKYNWDMFLFYDTNPSFGEKFHKYIYEYTCNCR